ncbi:MAG: hypothetical protein ABIR46_00420 [Candidatus Saccharimonadales bacterium]
MTSLSMEELKRWKKIFAEDGITYENDGKYIEAVTNLVGYFDTLIQIERSQKIKKDIRPES